jgi:hypothetical protein
MAIADALDDPAGVWTGSLSSDPLLPGWIGVMNAESHDGVDAARVSRSGPSQYALRRTVPTAGTVSFWWRRTGEQYSGYPLELAMGGVPLLEYRLYGGWGRISVRTSAGAGLSFTERPRYQTSWVDEFSFVPAAVGASVGDVLDVPGLEVYAISSGQPWEDGPGDAAPGAPSNGCLHLPANVRGGLKIKISQPGILTGWVRTGGPGANWIPETWPILVAPAVVTVGQFLPVWANVATQQPAWDYPSFAWNTTSPFAAFSVDGLHWEPAPTVPLGEALETTLEVTGNGWQGIALPGLSLDGVDSALARQDGATMSVVINGPGRVRFQGSHSPSSYGAWLGFSVDGQLVESIGPGPRTINYEVVGPGPHTLTWQGAAGSLVDALTIETIPPPQLTPLNDALDTPSIQFTHDPAADWTGQVTPAAADGVDAAVGPFLAPVPSYPNHIPLSWSSALTASFTLTETSRIRFRVKFDRLYDGRYFLELDGLVGTFYAGSESWTEVTLLTGPGSHTLRWLAVQSPGIYANSPPPIVQRRLMLDQVVIEPVGGPSPASALEYPQASLVAGPEGEPAVDTNVTHDGHDSLRFTLPPEERWLLRLTRNSPDYYFHCWARTDAPPGTVLVNDVSIASGEWVPLIVFNLDSIEPGLTIRGPAGARVWLDEVLTQSSDAPSVDTGGALDYPDAGLAEGYVQRWSGIMAHDGADVVSGQESSNDDNALLHFVVPVTGPATASFWWRSQRSYYEWGGNAGVAIGWVSISESNNYIPTWASAPDPWSGVSALMDTRYSRPWQQVTFQVPAGPQTVRIFMRGHAGTTLFLDQFEVGPPNPLATFAGSMSARGLVGPSADPDADPDGDGVSNLAEFTFGSDPSQRSPALSGLEWSNHDDSPVVRWRGFRPEALPYLSPDIEASPSMEANSWASLLSEWRASYYPSPQGFASESDGTVTFTVPAFGDGIPPNAVRLFFRGQLLRSPAPPEDD